MAITHYFLKVSTSGIISQMTLGVPKFVWHSKTFWRFEMGVTVQYAPYTFLLLFMLFSCELYGYSPSHVLSYMYSTNHVYLHRPNAFWFLANAFAPVLRNTQTHFEPFWIGLRIRNAFGMNRNCTFRVCLFSQILICDLWAFGGFSFIQN